MKVLQRCILAMFLVTSLTSVAFAANNQVFYRGGYSYLNTDRAHQVFTDTNGLGGNPTNDKKSGWNIGAGLDLTMIKDVGPGDLLGEVMLNYSQYSKKEVLQTTSALLGGTAKSRVAVSEFMAVVAPKYRLGSVLGGKVKPWIIPVGLAFLVNSPPSNDTTYLDIGLHLGLGVEYQIIDALSVGADYRLTIAANQPHVSASGGSANLYVGINF